MGPVELYLRLCLSLFVMYQPLMAVAVKDNRHLLSVIILVGQHRKYCLHVNSLYFGCNN